jgi:hypothetical protein
MLGAIFAVLMVGTLAGSIESDRGVAAIARRVIRDMIATITVATTSTAGAVVIAATPAAAVMVVTCVQRLWWVPRL